LVILSSIPAKVETFISDFGWRTRLQTLPSSMHAAAACSRLVRNCRTRGLSADTRVPTDKENVPLRPGLYKTWTGFGGAGLSGWGRPSVSGAAFLRLPPRRCACTVSCAPASGCQCASALAGRWRRRPAAQLGGSEDHGSHLAAAAAASAAVHGAAAAQCVVGGVVYRSSAGLRVAADSDLTWPAAADGPEALAGQSLPLGFRLVRAARFTVGLRGVLLLVTG
jgi:hypothetical protein